MVDSPGTMEKDGHENADMGIEFAVTVHEGPSSILWGIISSASAVGIIALLRKTPNGVFGTE